MVRLIVWFYNFLFYLTFFQLFLHFYSIPHTLPQLLREFLHSFEIKKVRWFFLFIIFRSLVWGIERVKILNVSLHALQIVKGDLFKRVYSFWKLFCSMQRGRQLFQLQVFDLFLFNIASSFSRPDWRQICWLFNNYLRSWLRTQIRFLKLFYFTIFKVC